jgi:sorbitol-specific phosphotransferase system component IIA
MAQTAKPTPAPAKSSPAKPTSAPQTDVPKALASSTSLLSFDKAKQLITEAQGAIAREDYTTARQKLEEARLLSDQLLSFYQKLAGAFSGLDARIPQEMRQKATRAADLRDEANLLLALVYRATDQADVAVPLLVNIVQFQTPTRDLGRKAYQQLYELGFVTIPFSAPSVPRGELPGGQTVEQLQESKENAAPAPTKPQ